MDEISLLLENHKDTHDSSISPIEDCPFCAREIGVPLVARHGNGNSSIIIPILPETF
jgi:hypothetical protein